MEEERKREGRVVVSEFLNLDYLQVTPIGIPLTYCNISSLWDREFASQSSHIVMQYTVYLLVLPHTLYVYV